MSYGINETNALTDGQAYHSGTDYSVVYELSDREVVKIDRLRLLSEPGYPYWDISYCVGVLANGTRVPVQLDVTQLGKRTWKTELVNVFRKAGRYAVGMGVFESVSTLN